MENDDVIQAAVAVVCEIIEMDAEDEEEQLRVLARVAAAQIMDEEEGGGLGAHVIAHWVPVAVNLDDYHNMGESFKLHFRMSYAVFLKLVNIVRDHLISKRRLRRERTPLEDIMLMVVWLLATPDSFRSVSLRFGVNPGTLYYFYQYVIEALRELAERFITWPAAEEREVIKGRYERASGFPGVVGAIDCTHITCPAPLVHSEQYINRHHQHSYNVQAVVDSTLLVRHLHVGEPGSMHDRRVFRNSQLFKDLLRDDNGVIMDREEHLLGDGGYVQTDFMMVPFQNNGHLTHAQLNFNKRLSQARVRVENAFGLAKMKWRRLLFLHASRPGIIVDHITASFVIHNFLVLNGELWLEEDELGRPVIDEELLGNADIAEDYDVMNELFAAANDRGLEKRIFYMDYVLPPPEE